MLPIVRESGASFFEATTALAFADFAARQVDIAVVEVGLGGRLDATNVIDPLVGAITQIALDHTDYLGDSLEGIAREKAGIAKPGRPLVVGESHPGLVGVIEEVGRAVRARTLIVPAGELYRAPLGLRGPHQRRNAAIARRVLEALPGAFRPADTEIRRAFAETRIPGRFDVRGKWIFDVAHNPNGLEALAATLDEFNPPRPLKVLVGILKDKDWPAMLARLLDLGDEVWVSDPPSAPIDRRWDLDRVKRTIGQGLILERDFDRALRGVRVDAGTVLVTGSFHTVGDALARLPGFAPLG
jgi:dihydrofolate synthase/folylpolyglutamate synthase